MLDSSCQYHGDNGRSHGKGVSPPSTAEVRERLIELIAEELQVDASDIDPRAQFTSYGLGSLQMISLSADLEDWLGLRLEPTVAYDNPTIAALAEYLTTATVSAAPQQSADNQQLERQPRGATRGLPLSFGQQQLWFLSQASPRSASYNETLMLRLAGPLDVDALQTSLHAIAAGHEALRTEFHLEDQTPIQRIAPRRALSVQHHDLSTMASVDRLPTAKELARQLAAQPFDLSNAPLARTHLLRLAPRDYVLLLVAHHIICDAWSLGVFARELTAYYAQACRQEPLPTPSVGIDGADFAVWQRRRYESGEMESDLRFWEEELAGSTPTIDLPLQAAPSPSATPRGATQQIRLTPEIAEALAAYSQRNGVTLFTTLLAAFKALLSRYSGQTDIVVGTTVVGRNRADLQTQIGYFVNTLALRTNLSSDPSFGELVRRVQTTCRRAFEHQDLPFERLVHHLRPDRQTATSPFFNVAFTLRNSLPDLKLKDVAMEVVDIHNGTSKFDISFVVEQKAEGLQILVEYNEDLLAKQTIEQLVGHYQEILARGTGDDTQRVSALRLVSRDDWQQIATWNDTQRSFAPANSIHELFAQQATRTPDAIAVESEQGSLTYRELDQRSNALAHDLHARGVRAETLCALCLDRSLELVVGMLAILKAGGAYIPIDPLYPAERIAMMLKDAAAPVLLTLRRHVESLPITPAETVVLDEDDRRLWDTNRHPLPRRTLPDHPAYAIYTSGSTGRPKAVLITHRAICNHMLWMHDRLPLTARDRVAQKTPISFDASVWEFYAPWLVGGPVVLARPGGHQDVDYLRDFLEQQQITILQVVPSLLRMLLAAGSKSFGCLRRLCCGGEALPTAAVEQFRDVCPAEIYNLYGPTEATIDASFFAWQPHTSEPSSAQLPTVPIGQPVSNTQMYVLDARLAAVPLGATGELYIAGTALGRGYVDQPAQTAERFLPLPFAAAAGERMYRTGDVVRYLPDGQLQYLGRTDTQVKVRGHRIETDEVEEVLRCWPRVQDAAVVLRQVSSGEDRLVAYIVTAADIPEPTTSEAMDYLRRHLPSYMIPSVFVGVTALPHTPSGKIDRQALPPPSMDDTLATGDFVPPASPTEHLLADVWKEVLGVEQVGRFDSFFELGGDSILSLQVVARARQSGLHITPQQIFEWPTVEGLAANVSHSTSVAAEQGIVTGHVRLTPIQRWFFEQEFPTPDHWNQTLQIELWQPLDPSLLHRSLHELLAHHDALRAKFVPDGNQWEQTLLPLSGERVLCHVDVSELDDDARQRAIESASQQLQASLRLAEGRLLRACYFEVGEPHRPILLLTAHHLAVDGVSWRVLLEDLETAYLQLPQGDLVLAPKTTSFREWSAQLHAAAEEERVLGDVYNWLSRDLPFDQPLPFDECEGENSEGSLRRMTVSLDAADTAKLLREAPATYRTEINDLLLTALAGTISAWTGDASVAVHLEGHGREDIVENVDVSRTVGWFTTVYPVQLHIPEPDDVGASIKSVKEQLRQIPHHGIGYGLVRFAGEQAWRDRLAAYHRPQLSFNYLGQADALLANSQLYARADRNSVFQRHRQAHREHLLDIVAWVEQGQLAVDWFYSVNRHHSATIERLAADFADRLRAIIRHCESTDDVLYTPSDFAEFAWDDGDLEQITAEISKSIEIQKT